MIHLDASTLEGGGQLPRLALALSALTLTPLHLTNIRANRTHHSTRATISTNPRKPRTTSTKTTSRPNKEGGLKESHLAALNFLAEACDAKVTGDDLGSREVTFKPRRACRLGDSVRIKLKNPGSVWLVFQALFPCVVFARQSTSKLGKTAHGKGGDGKEDQDDVGERTCFKIVLCGGTNVDKSMSLEYMRQVFLPVCRKIGLPEVKVECRKRGWAGVVGELGEVEISIDIPPPKQSGGGFQLNGCRIDGRGDIVTVVVNVLAHTQQIRTTVRALITEKLRLALGHKLAVEVEADEDSGHDSRFYVLLVAHTSNGWRLGRDFLGSGRKVRNERERDLMLDKAVAQVVGDLVDEISGGACVDEHMQDQLVVFQALAKGESVVKGREGVGTLHTQTVRWVCDQILGEKGVAFDAEGGCTGIGFNWAAEEVDEATKGLKELDIRSGDY